MFAFFRELTFNKLNAIGVGARGSAWKGSKYSLSVLAFKSYVPGYDSYRLPDTKAELDIIVTDGNTARRQLVLYIDLFMLTRDLMLQDDEFNDFNRSNFDKNHKKKIEKLAEAALGDRFNVSESVDEFLKLSSLTSNNYQTHICRARMCMKGFRVCIPKFNHQIHFCPLGMSKMLEMIQRTK